MSPSHFDRNASNLRFVICHVETGHKQDIMKSRYLVPSTDDTPARPRLRPRAVRVTASWWKAEDYKLVKDGTAIAPIGAVQPHHVLPQDIDWASFLAWSATGNAAHTPRRFEWWRPTLLPPSADVAEQMRQWCRQHGCPGTLLLWAKRLVDPAAPPTPKTPSATQVRHDRVGHVWQRRAYSVPIAKADDAGAYLAKRFHHVELLPPRFTQGLEVKMLTPTAVAAFFKRRVAKFTSPAKADFWQRYREPTVELLRASHYLRDVAAAATSDETVHQAAMADLKAGVGLSGMHWQVASLLHAYALRPEPKLVSCRRCNEPFLLNGKQMFCDDTCENSYNKKERRNKPRT